MVDHLQLVVESVSCVAYMSDSLVEGWSNWLQACIPCSVVAVFDPDSSMEQIAKDLESSEQNSQAGSHVGLFRVGCHVGC